jgi:hypothetical protein
VPTWFSLTALFMGAFGFLIASTQHGSRIGMALSFAFLIWVLANAIKTARMSRRTREGEAPAEP